VNVKENRKFSAAQAAQIKLAPPDTGTSIIAIRRTGGRETSNQLASFPVKVLQSPGAEMHRICARPAIMALTICQIGHLKPVSGGVRLFLLGLPLLHGLPLVRDPASFFETRPV
jgi:hypothetical protein